MEKYLGEWITVIDGMKNDNTYKASWGKAIIECLMEKKYQTIENKIFVEEYFIVEKILKYYWNLNNYFGLTQGRYLVVEKITEELANEYNQQRSTDNPVLYGVAESFIKRDSIKYERHLGKLLKAVNDNVAYRFLKYKKKELHLYEIDFDRKSLIFSKEQLNMLKENKKMLLDLIHFKWALNFEKFNLSPKILKKVSNAHLAISKKKNLDKYKEFLYRYYDGAIVDFYTGEPLELSQVKLSHVIPRHYIYSYDIWNMVITNKNKRYSVIPNKKDIEKLKERNMKIINKYNNKSFEFESDFMNAETNKLIDLFYSSLNG
ncbi:MAG: hypothetical protein JXR62_06520 [Bacilli bacterium]|nr:hypothetical protein [Bacilli bacterium]